MIESAAVATRPQQTQGGRMLVVDDQPEIYDYICGVMHGSSRHCTSIDYAASGSAAVERVSASVRDCDHYRVAFVDVLMPGSNGVQVANELWGIDPRLSVILSSGASVDQFLKSQSALSRPEQSYMLQKPFLAQELRQIVNACIESSRVFDAKALHQSSGPPRIRLHRALDQCLNSARSAPHSLLRISVDQLECHVASGQTSELDYCAGQIASLIAIQLDRLPHEMYCLDMDEFAVLLPDCDREAALKLADELLQIRSAVSLRRFVPVGEVTLSIGIVSFLPGAGRADEILLTADIARRNAQAAGGDTARLSSPYDSAVVRVVREHQVIPEIEQALKCDRLELWAQPILPLRAGPLGMPSLELLLRMKDSSGILRGPDHFLASAERFGLMARIDRHVVRKAISLFDGSVDLAGIDHLAVNVSAQLLNDPSGMAWLEEVLLAAKATRERLCIEITESSELRRKGTVSSFINRMTDLGVRFALDDFGAGFSTFDYLQTLPVAYLKVDGSLIRGCAADTRRIELLRRIVDIGQAWGKQTVAEQVEDVETLEAVRSLGFDAVQGFLLARPAAISGAARLAHLAMERFPSSSVQLIT